MHNPYGDFYPKGERYPDPVTYPTPEAVGRQAAEVAEVLIGQAPLQYGLTEMHMRALAGLYNGFASLDEQVFNRMPPSAQIAATAVADASHRYLVHMGQEQAMAADISFLYPDTISEVQRCAYLTNTMQQHVQGADMAESVRRTDALRRGVLPAEDQVAAELDRFESAVPYSEDGIRDVLKVFGGSLSYVIRGFAETAPLDRDRREIVHHAAGCIAASDPRRFSE